MDGFMALPIILMIRLTCCMLWYVACGVGAGIEVEVEVKWFYGTAYHFDDTTYMLHVMVRSLSFSLSLSLTLSLLLSLSLSFSLRYQTNRIQALMG
jgi:hypothetical protein